MNYSIVLTTQPTQFQAATFSGDLDGNLARIAGMGYDGVELAIRDPRLINLEEMDAVLARHRLSVPAIGTGQAWGEEGLSFCDPQSEIRRQAIERIKQHIPLAANWNAVIIIGLVRGITKAGVTQKQAFDWVVDALKECTQVAGMKGVRLAVEPINRYETTLVNNCNQGLELISRVGANNLGLLLDTFHMNIEEADLHTSIQLVGNRIFHFHVADSNRHHPGAGHLDFPGILTTLTETGYLGFVSGEFLPLPDADSAAQAGIAYLRGLSI